MRIFVSYRRDDSSAHAGRLYDALAREYGRHNVFQDVAAVEAGENFEEAIQRALQMCDVVLVVIGPDWLAPAGSDGISRLFRPDDYVRIEVAQALRSHLRIIPVLVGEARMPVAPDLPEELSGLAIRQALSLRDDSWQRDAEDLLRSLRGEPRKRQHRPRWLATAAGVGVIAMLGIAGLLWWDGGPDDESGTLAAAALPSCETPTTPEWTQLYDPAVAQPVIVGAENGQVEFTVTDSHYRPMTDSGAWELVLATAITNLDLPDGLTHEESLYYEVEIGNFPFGEKTCFFTERAVLNQGQSARALVGFRVSEEPIGGLDLIAEYDNAYGLVPVNAG